MVAVGPAQRCSSFLHDRFSDMVALAIQGKAELWGYAAGHILYMSNHIREAVRQVAESLLMTMTNRDNEDHGISLA